MMNVQTIPVAIQSFAAVATLIVACVIYKGNYGTAVRSTVDRSIEFMHRYRDSPLADQRYYNGEMQNEIFQSHDNPEGFDLEGYMAEMKKAVREPIFRGGYKAVIEFFEHAYVCVEEKSCDRKSINSIFEREAREYLTVHHAAICEIVDSEGLKALESISGWNDACIENEGQ